MEDLGSGALVDLSRYGLPKEPVVSERIAIGADLVTFSGDKVLGGPQAGLAVGRASLLKQMAANPLHRAVRCGKLTIAALEATLRLYRESACLDQAIPTLRMFTRPLAEIENIAQRALPALAAALGAGFRVSLQDSTSQIGSGALPDRGNPDESHRHRARFHGADRIAGRFRQARPPIIGRVADDQFLLDAADDLRPARSGAELERRTRRAAAAETLILSSAPSMPFIIGTAGHIDHGKTSLVKALTGQDTDRLKEEKERGISIELGFAHLDLPDGTRAGVVDVPGHERFIRTMLAGAHGMDLVLFTVAADDGVMPQTVEHLDILHLLGVTRAIFVITKADLATAARVAEVEAEIERLAAGTVAGGLAGGAASRSPLAKGSTASQPRSRGHCRRIDKPPPPGYFRLPVDRVVRPAGTRSRRHRHGASGRGESRAIVFAAFPAASSCAFAAFRSMGSQSRRPRGDSAWR